MAETAAIISPDKKILIPASGAGCSLAESITGYELREWKKANPDGIIVSYVNTTAEVKAWTDICCTSANALKVVQSIPPDHKILFVPDKTWEPGSGKLPDGKWNSGMEIVVYTNASPPT